MTKNIKNETLVRQTFFTNEVFMAYLEKRKDKYLVVPEKVFFQAQFSFFIIKKHLILVF